MEQKKGKLTGTARVYRFSLCQMLKNKANLAFLILIIVVSVCAVPVAALTTGAGLLEEESPVIERVAVYNETEYHPKLEDVGEAVFFDAIPENALEGLGSREACVTISGDSLSGYEIRVLAPQDTELGEEALSRLCRQVTEAFEAARYEALGIKPEQMEGLMKGYRVERSSREEYLGEEQAGFEARFSIQYLYAVLVMMVSVFAVSYIVRSVIEEKSSKLVETLMVSVRPLALLAGKILAAMSYILILLCLAAAGFGLSWTVSGRFLDLGMVAELVKNMGLGAEILRLDGLTAAAILVSVALAYLVFSVLSGLAGACCSSMDDVEGANMKVILVIVGCYLISLTGAGTRGGWAVALAVCPVLSAFTGPALYMMGSVSFGVLALSWVLQALVIGGLLWFAARIYDSLLMYRGSRVKLSQLFAMAGRGGEGR